MNDEVKVIHPDNHRLRAEFLADMRANGVPEQRVRQRQSTTDHVLLLAGDRPLACLSLADLKAMLGAATHRQTGKGLSGERLRKLYSHARELLDFAMDRHPQAFAHIQRRHVRHLCPDRGEGSAAATDRRPYYTLKDVQALAQLDLRHDLTLWRAQACACVQFLGGLRIGSLATLPVCAIDCDHLRVQQDPRLGVRTKLRKHATTVLLDVPDILAPSRAWLDYLHRHASARAMFFNVFTATDPPHVSDALPGAHRAIALTRDYKQLCVHAGLSYRGSHALRHGHIVHCARQCRDLSDFTALSQNVMHSDVRVTMHYAAMSEHGVAQQYRRFATQTHTSVELIREPEADVRASAEVLSGLLRSGEANDEQRKVLKALVHEIVELL